MDIFSRKIGLAAMAILTLAATAVHGQSNAAGKLAQADVEFFERKVRPLLARRCYACHSAKAKQMKKLRGGLTLDSAAGLRSGGDSGPVVTPAKPENSSLIEAIRYENPDLQMPPAGKLPDGEIAVLVAWVKRGAPFPGNTTDLVDKKQTVDLAAGRKFWSFRPFANPKTPDCRNRTWPRRRIDAFVLARLETQGISPSSQADKRVLLRRATFDLTGLPPTPAEVEEFVNDDSPHAYDQLIERLLASPRYGERWGRDWLDLTRYSDSTASWLKSTGSAYLYRDWVVRAFNEDLPYDEFVKRQLAADQMPEAAAEDIAALGLIGLSPTYWKELKLDKEVIKGVVAEEWEERINAVFRTFLGLTAACARCHDHKFDPVTMEDYYALAGVFASTRFVDRAVIPAPDASRVKRARDQVGSLKEKLKQLKAKKQASPAEKQQAQSQAAALQSRIEQIKQSTPYYDSPLAHAVEDASLYVMADGPDSTKLVYKAGKPRDLPVFRRGNPSNPGPIVPRRFLAVFSSGTPKPFKNGSGRLELAEAILNEAGPLAARVIVNRIWRRHFGRGLVTTPSDFGSQGDRPTHPQLLDDLAGRFVRHGWSIKWLHREIMLSAVYQQASDPVPAAYAADPENRLLWRMNRRRLNVEAWRDAMLSVSGQLDSRVGGPAVKLDHSSNRRRTIYGKIERRQLNAMLRLYDFPDPTGHSPRRDQTTTPLQQLFMLNSRFILRQSAALAGRIHGEDFQDERTRIDRAYQLLFARSPSKLEMRLGLEFLSSAFKSSSASGDLWRQYAQVLLGSNEFTFVD